MLVSIYIKNPTKATAATEQKVTKINIPYLRLNRRHLLPRSEWGCMAAY